MKYAYLLENYMHISETDERTSSKSMFFRNFICIWISTLESTNRKWILMEFIFFEIFSSYKISRFANFWVSIQNQRPMVVWEINLHVLNCRYLFMWLSHEFCQKWIYFAYYKFRFCIPVSSFRNWSNVQLNFLKAWTGA